MKSNLKRLIFTVGFLVTVFVIVLSKPIEKVNDNYEGVITQSVANNFAGSYKQVNDFNVEKALEEKKRLEEEERKKSYVYENLNKEQLVKLLNKSLNSTLSNKGELIATHCLKKGVDPVLATAIILQETGCKWSCSALVKKCNNVGGIVGSPACMGVYKGYSSLDTGIRKFIDNLADNFYAYGLNTPEKMNPKYAESKDWAAFVNRYIKEIKSYKSKVLK